MRSMKPMASSRRVVSAGVSSTSAMVCPLTLLRLPVQRALLPHVDQPGNQRHREHQHLSVAEPPELLEVDGPRVEKDGLDVENDEQQRGHVELNREPGPMRGAGGLRTGLEVLGL